MFNFLRRKSKPSVDRNRDITSMAAWESREKVLEAPEPEPVKTPELEAPKERKARAPRHHAEMDEVLDVLKVQAPEVYKAVEVVGLWLWIDDAHCPCDLGTLALLHRQGFIHNNKRGVFQLPCSGRIVRESPLGTSELKAKYSAVPAPEYAGDGE